MKKILYLILAIFILVVATGFFSRINQNSACPVEKALFTVRGNSMVGLLESGQEVTASMGYYQCHDARRGDIVLYKLAASSEPIVKIVRAIPGDTWSLQEVGDRYQIIVNGRVLTTSKNEPYQFGSKNAALLENYIRDYKGIIPENAYLIFGNQVSGSVDSSRLGLVSKKDFLGKVIPK